VIESHSRGVDRRSRTGLNFNDMPCSELNSINFCMCVVTFTGAAAPSSDD